MAAVTGVLRVLVIEDNLLDLRWIQEVLSAAATSFEVECTNNLKSALILLRSPAKKFDVILLDLGLPDSQGIDSCAAVIKACDQIPCVILSNADDERTALLAIRMGAEDFLRKDVTEPARLCEALQFAVQRRRRLNGRQKHTVGSGHGLPLPVWDSERRELRVGDVVVKRFRQPSLTQEVILAAFQEESWIRKLDDPLPPQEGVEAKYRLRATIRSLNTRLSCPLIRFFGDGTGTAVCWEFVNLDGKDPVIVTTRGIRTRYAHRS